MRIWVLVCFKGVFFLRDMTKGQGPLFRVVGCVVILQFAQVGSTSGDFVYFLVLWVPAHLT